MLMPIHWFHIWSMNMASIHLLSVDLFTVNNIAESSFSVHELKNVTKLQNALFYCFIKNEIWKYVVVLYWFIYATN